MISNLQVLRGVAALAVVFYHTAFTFNGGVHTEFQAVSVFFVISGFIMTYVTRNDASQFLRQRLIRIVPLYWLCTTVAIAAAMIKGSGRLWADASVANIARCLLFIPYLDQSAEFHPLLAVGWTLNLEMFFYLVFSVTLVISRRWAPLLTCMVLVAIRIAHDHLGCTALLCEFYAHDYTTYLVLGILSFYVWRALDTHVADARWVVVPLAGLFVVAFALWNSHPPFAAAVQQWFAFPLYRLMPAMLVIAGLLLHSARIWCRWPIMLLLGDASYALYLTHTLIMEVMRIARDRIFAGDAGLVDPRQSAIAMVGVLAICSVVAVVVHSRAEAPMLRMLRRLLVTRAPPRRGGPSVTDARVVPQVTPVAGSG
jgi:exopolysaccharide production protein ExoZ